MPDRTLLRTFPPSTSQAVPSLYKYLIQPQLQTQQNFRHREAKSLALKMRHTIAVPARLISSFLKKLHRMVSPKKTPQQLVLHLPPATLSGGLDMVFCCFDENGDGKISPVELHNCMTTSAAKLSLEEAEEIVRSIDSDNDGMLSMDEFSQLVEGPVEEERTLREAFGAYEMEGRGCITPDSLKRALENLDLGGPTTIKKCREMIRRFDIDGDGVISFEEFSLMMTIQD